MLRRGAVLATAFSALLAAPAAASLDVTVPLDSSLRSLDPSPTAFNFGAWPVGSTSGTQTFTFTFNENCDGCTDHIQAIGTVGGNTKDFQVLAPGSEGDCFAGESLFDGSSCTVNVEFVPKATGVRTTTLRVTDDRGNQGNVSLFGTGAVPSVSPSSLSFGNQPVGTTSPVQQVTVTNTSFGTFTGISPSTSGQFAVTRNGCPTVLRSGDACTMDVAFVPTSPGAQNGSLTIASDSGNQNVPLSGTGTVHLAHAPASLAFGNQLTNSPSATQNVTFTNDSQGTVTPGAATVGGTNADQFAIASNGCTAPVAPGGTCVIGVRFQPTTTGAKSASLSLASNSTGSPDVIALTGTGTAAAGGSSSSTPPGPGPGIGFDVSTLAFGARIVQGGELRQTLTLNNTGDQPLAITALALTGPNAGDFSLGANHCSPGTLAPGASCTVDIDFLPSAAGDRNASLLISDNAPGSPQSLPLTGSGLPPPTLYRTANAEPVSGEVTVALPPGATSRASVLKGRRFIPLREARQVPIGSVFDTRKGRVRIATATLTPTKAQAGQFFAGLFQLLQRRSEKSLTEAKLVGSNFKSCSAPIGKTTARIARRKKISSKVIRTLKANVKGKFRTRGRFAAATVRGTIWGMQDRCDGTLTRVQRGTVVVRDLRTERNIVVRSGKSALVPRP